MNSGSTSSDRHAPTHAPQWMHAIDCVTSIIDSAGTMYSRSGGGPSGSRRLAVVWRWWGGGCGGVGWCGALLPRLAVVGAGAVGARAWAPPRWRVARADHCGLAGVELAGGAARPEWAGDARECGCAF